MAFSNYSDLKSYIGGFLARSSGMDARIADAVALFEARYNAGEENYFAEQVATLTTVAGDPLVSLPTDFNEQVVLAYADGTPVRIVALSALNPSESRGQPLRAAIYPDNRLKLECVPDGVYTLELVYDAKLAALSDETPSNWMLVQFPYLYAYGALLFMLDYLQDGMRAETIEGRSKVFMGELDGKRAAKKLGRTPTMQIQRGMP